VTLTLTAFSPVFEPPKARHFDSSWDWVRQDTLLMWYDIPHPFATALTAPPLVSFNISNFSVQPQLQFAFNAPNGQSDVIYRLSAVLYFGSAHFTSRYIDVTGTSWSYDGQCHHGMMVSEGLATSVSLTSLNNRRPSVLFFLCVSWVVLIITHSNFPLTN
jgi:3-oxoacyl-ACP reductase-like protein